jgi:PAS domain S-box-containing protein
VSRPRSPVARARAWLEGSLHHRLLAALVALVLAFVALVGIATFVASHRLVRRTVDERLDADAELVAGEIAHELREAYGDIEALSKSTLLSNALVDSHGRDRYVAPFLGDFRPSVETTVRLGLCDDRGRLVAASLDPPSLDGARWVDDVVGRGQVTAHLHLGGLPHLFIAFPVLSPGSGSPTGAFVAEIELSPLLREAIARHRRAVALRLVSAGGDFVDGQRGGWEERITRRQALTVPAPLERLDLAVDAGLPRDTVARALRLLAVAHVAAAVLVLLLAAAAARVLAERLARPVRLLAEAADHVSDGAALGTRVPTLGVDEVGRLGAAFNAMLARVEAATAAEQAREVSERRRAERALQLAQAAIEHSSEALAIVKPDGTVAFGNEAATRLAGGDQAPWAGRNVWELLPGLDEQGWRREWQEVKRSGAVLRERSGRGQAGATTCIEISASHLAFEGGEYCIVALRDVSGRKQAESAVRLASIGTLAAGTAHEINNPLTYLSGNLAYVEEELAARVAGASDAAPPEEVLQAVREAREGADRVREIVQALRTFARRDDGDARAPVDVRRSLQAALVIGRGEIKHRARLVTRFDEGLPPVLAPGHRLEQVWLNLLVNAAQAIEPGNPEANEIAVAVLARGREVVVEVHDTGCGMSPDVKARIFEPFFTTKPAGAGTGLGLSLCHGIIASVGGRIEVKSEPGHGTTFRVVLPAAPQDGVAAASPAASVQAGVGARGRVLVVDDDALVGKAIRRVLPPEQEVFFEADPRRALARVRCGEAFDVVLCDLAMPEMSGLQFHAAVASASPALAAKMIFMTGGAFDTAAREFLAQSGKTCLPKPFAPDVLRQAVAQRLAAA